MTIYFLFLFKGFSRVHYLPLVVYPHTNQPQPTATTNTSHYHTPYTHTITYPIILFHYIITIHDNRYYTLTRSPLSSYILIYNIIYLATILYPISHGNSYTRAIISKRQPTPRPDTLYRYTYYMSTHSMTSARHQIRNGNSWR